MKKRHSMRFTLIALLNAVAVFLINIIGKGGLDDSSISGLVQMILSPALAGFTGPHVRRSALVYRSPFVAYTIGAFLMASFVGVMGYIVHTAASTPEVWWTVAWNFALNFIFASFMIWCLRHKAIVPRLHKVFIRL